VHAKSANELITVALDLAIAQCEVWAERYESEQKSYKKHDFTDSQSEFRTRQKTDSKSEMCH